MNTKQIVEKFKDTYESLPKIAHKRKLWHCSFYDGAINGVCEVNSEKCWFERIAECDNYEPWWWDHEAYCEYEPPYYRRFLIFKLTEKQYNFLAKEHQEFIDAVGGHFIQYDENNRRIWGPNTETKATKESANAFWKRAVDYAKGILVRPECPNFTEDQIIGWNEV